MPKPVKKSSPTLTSAYASQLGGNSAPGGTPRLEPLSDKQRREVAMKAAKARWQTRAASERISTAATKPKRA